MGERRSGAGNRQQSAAAARRRLEVLDAQLAGTAVVDDPRQISVGGQTNPGLQPAGSAPLSSGTGRHVEGSLPRRRRLAAALGDRRPASPDLTGRGVSSHHVAVIAVVLSGCLALTAWWVLAGRARPDPVAAATLAPAEPMSPNSSYTLPAAGSTPPPSSSTSPSGLSAPTPALVIVDVAGKVRHPGIVTLPPGSRVVDALEAAGGTNPSVDLTSLNLARQLVDGEQLLVGLTPVAVAAPPGAAVPPPTNGLPVAQVNLNTATSELLDTLPGVGPVTAQAILDWRTEHGSYSSVDELLEVDGIGEATLAGLRDLVTV